MATNELATQPFRTWNDLILKALANLGVIATGQAVSPEDFANVQSDLDSIFRMLAALEVCYVSDAMNIPGEWFGPLADIVAGQEAIKFGAVGQSLVDKINMGLGGAGGVPIGAGVAAQVLKIMLRGRPAGEPQRTESF